MASEAGIQLFVQHLLAKKYLSMDDLSALVRGISRGTGHDYGSNKGFIKEVNDCLSELGFMLKDLESFHTTTTRARVPASSGTRNESRSENTSRVFEHVFTPSEVSIYMVNRFEKEGWLQFVDGRDCIVPGVKSCRSCTGAVHLLCSTRVDDEIRHCRKCAHDIAESN
eukprot:XP_001612081.1 hypothetical protein [Babesia bovis T2Bo]